MFARYARIKTFKEKIREKIANNGILFLQKTHSSHDIVISWGEEFKGELLFSHETTNSCGVMTGYLGSKQIKINRKKMIIKVEFS